MLGGGPQSILRHRPDIPSRLLVADNSEAGEARTVVEAIARSADRPVRYLHAPARNISIARNACLEASLGEWIAFLDDDELVRPDWLDSLLKEAASGGWDAVLGPVQAVYPDSAPGWMKSGGFHSTAPVRVRGQILTGYTGNVLIRRQTIGAVNLRFKPEFGRTGGEDLDFFYRLSDAG